MSPLIKVHLIFHIGSILAAGYGDTNVTLGLFNVQDDKMYGVTPGVFTAPFGTTCDIYAIVKLIGILKWTTVVTISDTTTAHQINRITDKLSENGVYLIKYDYDSISSTNETQEMLTVTYDNLQTAGINVLLLCRMACFINILRQANSFDSIAKHHKTAMNQRSSWLVTLPVDFDLDVVGNVTFELDNVAVLMYSKGIKAENISVNEMSMLIEIYTLIWGLSGRQFSRVGNLYNQDITHLKVFPNVHYGFNGRRFLVTTIPWYPFVMKTVIDNSTHYYGFCIDVLEDLAKSLNFTYRLTEPPDYEWGVRWSNGSWSGMVGQIQRGDVDMIAAPLVIEASREFVMDFTYPIYFDSWTFLMRRPEAGQRLLFLSPLSWQVFLCVGVSLPVSAAILYLIETFNPFFKRHDISTYSYQQFFWYIFGGILYKVSSSKWRFSNSGRLFVSFWWIFAIIVFATYSGNLVAMLSVTLEEAPFNTFEGLVDQDVYKWGTLGGTIYLNIMELSVNILISDKINSYEVEEENDLKNGLSRTITKCIPNLTISGFIGDVHLVSHGKVFNEALRCPLPQVTRRHLALQHKQYCKFSENPVFQKMFAGIERELPHDPEILNVNQDKHVEKVLKENYVYLGEKSYFEILSRNDCRLVKAKEDYPVLNYGIGLPNNSPYTRLFSQTILKMTEHGFPEIWMEQNWPKSQNCKASLRTEAKSVSFTDLQAAFYLAVSGVILCVVVLIMEFVIKRLCISILISGNQNNKTNKRK